jgi:hypothetical protein
MLLNFDYQVKTVDDVAVKSAAMCVAELLSGKAENIDSVKAWDWALSLKRELKIEVDRADAEALEKAVEKSELFNFAKAPILLTIRAAKELAKEAVKA